MRAIHLAISLGLAAAAGDRGLRRPRRPCPRSGSSSTSSTPRRAACCAIPTARSSARRSSRDLGATEQRLRSFKTRSPNAAATPLLERQLDRLSRPTDLGSRGPVPLLGER